MALESLPAGELFKLAGILPTAATLWGDNVPCKGSGVYVISVLDMTKVRFLEPFDAKERQHWRDDQEIIYIGRARVLSRRLRQFRRHVYGASAPHRGGQAILLLNCPKIIHWAAVEDYGKAEDALIRAFQAHAGRMPFGNRVRSARMSKISN